MYGEAEDIWAPCLGDLHGCLSLLVVGEERRKGIVST